ncbi:biotin--[acetyl-CoA-carboxylase] ligase [Butyrivibrio sp. WCD3002]|uniref:biotin--[acetyl-CoA-carboxylase] ligase n=1 Tax=Butyrivibrio sp. WCD3002 TaxID=1280676 RepID=UPI00040B3913|nr:biotin--[acetyl-CoA-carboxylase] ligase [Butyrivibrio sp. WCD3002]
MMDKRTIEAALNTDYVGRDLEFYPVIDSTNNIAKAAGDEGRASGFLAVADRQDAGRGSRGRSWISPAGHNIFMSLMVRPKIPMDKVSGLTLVMALSVSEALDKAMTAAGVSDDVRTGIKWPNDIVLNKRKICGILTELHMMPGSEEYFVVIGCGINVNQPSDLFAEEIRDMAGSVFSETGKELDRSKLIALCMKYFEENYARYVERCDLSLLKDEYEKRLLNRDSKVKILDPKGEYEAVALGINKEGALLIKNENGDSEEIIAGEVSVRGLYGYV